MSCLPLDSSVIKNGFFDNIDYVLTDCDGVLWNGNFVIEGIPETLSALREKGKRIIFVTNNSSKTRKEYVDKCQKLGIQATEDEIFGTAHCIALYLSSIGFKKKVYLVGPPAIVTELKSVGIECLPIGPDPTPGHWQIGIPEVIPLDSEVGAVVVGFDYHISYVKLMKAASYLNKDDCLFLVSNTDDRFPFGDTGLVIPGTGVLVAAVQVASRREPTIVGKPSLFMFDCIRKVFADLKPERSIMIGDRLTTDIALGKRAGMHTLFVLTGISSLKEAESYKANPTEENEEWIPDYWLPSLGNLSSLLNSPDL